MERERLMKIEERFRTAVRVARVLYALAGLRWRYAGRCGKTAIR